VVARAPQVNIDYARTMNKVVFDTALEAGRAERAAGPEEGAEGGTPARPAAGALPLGSRVTAGGGGAALIPLAEYFPIDTQRAVPDKVSLSRAGCGVRGRRCAGCGARGRREGCKERFFEDLVFSHSQHHCRTTGSISTRGVGASGACLPPRQGCVRVDGSYDFPQQYSEFSFRTLLTKAEVITALSKIKVECAKVRGAPLAGGHGGGAAREGSLRGEAGGMGRPTRVHGVANEES
jgi:hypothetical protein